jgi:hypothetical protein
VPGGVHASPHALAAGAPELTHRVGGHATVGAAAFAVHAARHGSDRDDARRLLDARAVMRSVGGAAFTMQVKRIARPRSPAHHH